MQLSEITKELFDLIVKFRQQVVAHTVPNVENVFHEFEAVFASMEAKAQKHSELVIEFEQVKYPLVALADEVVLNSDWSEAREWDQYLLERKYYTTNIAGNKFFQLLEKADKMSPSVLKVFFFCLAFGFKGGFSKNDPSLRRLRGRLLSKAVPEPEFAEERLIPGAYCIVLGETTKLKRLWKWWHVAVAAVLFFTFLIIIESVVIWPIILGNVVDNVETAKTITVAENAGGGEKKGVQPQQVGYIIVLSVFSEKTEALALLKLMKENGFSARVILTMKDGISEHAVVTQEFFSIESAAKKMSEIDEKDILSNEMNVVETNKIKGECIAGC